MRTGHGSNRYGRISAFGEKMDGKKGKRKKSNRKFAAPDSFGLISLNLIILINLKSQFNL